MGQRIKFYMGHDEISVQEHLGNDNTYWYSNFTNIFYNLLKCC